MRKKFLFALLAVAVVGVGFWLGVRRAPGPAPAVSPPAPTEPPMPTSTVRQVDMKKQTYDITYVPSLDEYAIVVYGSPFEPARKEAERAFLQKLGVAPEQACRLKVTVSTPVFVNPEESKQTYGLSFCSP
ncbi:MAG: hypothetical protein AAB803_01085 [Patescibacteria group bacterium]